MGFAEKYVRSVNSSDLRADEFHHQTVPLAAAAMADTNAVSIGRLLSRVKYSDGTVHKDFESGSANLAQLLRAWCDIVAEKGAARRWLGEIRTEWDACAARKLYQKVAEQSLAYWLDGLCKTCQGTGNKGPDLGFAACDSCKGSCKAELPPMEGLVRKKTEDMIAELEDLLLSHNRRAQTLLRED